MEPGKAKAPPGRSTELGQPQAPADEQRHPPHRETFHQLWLRAACFQLCSF